MKLSEFLTLHAALDAVGEASHTSARVFQIMASALERSDMSQLDEAERALYKDFSERADTVLNEPSQTALTSLLKYFTNDPVGTVEAVRTVVVMIEQGKSDSS